MLRPEKSMTVLSALALFVPASLCLALLSVPASADWKVRPVTSTETIKAICEKKIQSDVLGTSLETEESDSLLRFTLRDAVANLCYDSYAGEPPNPDAGQYIGAYFVTFSLKEKEKERLLVAESDMMAWPLDYTLQGDQLVFRQYWDSRSVKTYTLNCEGPCRLDVACKIQPLETDTRRILKAIQPYLIKPPAERSVFLMGENPQEALLMNQLFMEAGSGNPNAMNALNVLAKDMDGAPAEVISTFIEYALDMQKQGCRWQPQK